MTDNICIIDGRKKCVDGTQKNINPSNRGGYLVVNISSYKNT